MLDKLKEYAVIGLFVLIVAVVVAAFVHGAEKLKSLFSASDHGTQSVLEIRHPGFDQAEAVNWRASVFYWHPDFIKMPKANSRETKINIHTLAKGSYFAPCNADVRFNAGTTDEPVLIHITTKDEKSAQGRLRACGNDLASFEGQWEIEENGRWKPFHAEEEGAHMTLITLQDETAKFEVMKLYILPKDSISP